jgi:glucose-1-phosphate adenylyltransferase
VRSPDEHETYWRDVGTLDAYFTANIDLTDVVPELDVYDEDWPIWTYAKITPPAKFVHDVEGRRGMAISSLVSGGCIVSGSELSNSLLCDNVHVHSFGAVDHGVILPYVDIGQRAHLTNVIVDAGVHIPAGLVVGEDPALDAARFRRTESGICLITQAMVDRLGNA